MNFMIQRFASETDIKVMEWPLEAGSKADRELRLLTDRTGRKEGAALQSQENSVFSLWQDLFFSHPGAQHRVLLLKGRGGKKSHPHPSSRQGCFCSYKAWSIGMGGSVLGLAGSVRHAVPSPQRDPCHPMPISQPAAPHASFQLHLCCRVLCK